MADYTAPVEQGLILLPLIWPAQPSPEVARAVRVQQGPRGVEKQGEGEEKATSHTPLSP